MKKFKFTLFSIAMALMVFTSCTNNEAIVEEQQNTEESASITASLNNLSAQFDQNGNLTADSNPAGNVVFDFCFDFVYPLDLSYNNGVTVTVNGLDDIVDLILSSTDDLYINGIAFPFDVETYNDDSNAIEVVTINNEEEFAELIENCDFDDSTDCICTAEANPVCVEITDPNGQTFIITYPNPCYAECDGFTEEDFVDNCAEDYNCPGGNGCFEFNFPISIITDNQETITVNSQQELDSAAYDTYYFDFVYPFDITLLNEEVVTINNQEDFEAVLEDCFGDNNNDDCEECENAGDAPVCVEFITATGETEIVVFPNMCYALCEGFSQADIVECEDDNIPDDCEECNDAPIDPVCVVVENPNGVTEIITFPNACYAECEGFTENDFVDCEDDNNPSDCSEEDIANILVECVWFGVSSLNPNNNSGLFTFNADGTVSVTIEGNTITGTWSLSSNPSTAEVFMSISLPAPYDGISSLDWTVAQCSEGFVGLESNNEFLSFERQCD